MKGWMLLPGICCLVGSWFLYSALLEAGDRRVSAHDSETAQLSKVEKPQRWISRSEAEAVLEEKYSLALRLTVAARTAAGRSKDAALIKDAAARDKEVRALKTSE